MNNNIMGIDTRIPVTIITGFWGAGKTTLLNNLIKTYHSKKFAIIENEFGEIGIDGGLIVGEDENIFELSNGCICCSINDGFHETIEKLLNSELPFNHLLIETTGIADPDSIIQAFFSSEQIQLNFRIDSVICIADCSNIEDFIDEQAEVAKQVALADVVILNKTDTVRAKYLDELETRIRSSNPTALIYPANNSMPENVDLLDLKAFTAKNIEKSTLSFKNMKLADAPVISHNPAPVLAAHTHHKHDIVSHGFIIPGSFNMEKFSLWLQNLLLFNREYLYRVKGIVSISSMKKKYILQAVRESCLFEQGAEWGNETRNSKLVFIGKKLNYDMLKDNLYQLTEQIGNN